MIFFHQDFWNVLGLWKNKGWEKSSMTLLKNFEKTNEGFCRKLLEKIQIKVKRFFFSNFWKKICKVFFIDFHFDRVGISTRHLSIKMFLKKKNICGKILRKKMKHFGRKLEKKPTKGKKSYTFQISIENLHHHARLILTNSIIKRKHRG